MNSLTPLINNNLNKEALKMIFFEIFKKTLMKKFIEYQR